jgi:predicted dehydrogenase/nucleoside-diphosphate-sugar epimerase
LHENHLGGVILAPQDPCQPRRVCLIGAGNVSRIHAGVLALAPTADAVAVCDTNVTRAQALADEHGFAHVFASLDEAIESAAFDSAHILLPPNLHASTARQLLAAGIGVLVEKPLAVSSEECIGLAALANSRGVPLGVNHNAVFNPAYLELRRQLLERVHGRLQHLMITWNLPQQALPRPEHWLFQQPQNLAFETAVHPFSQVYDLAGPLVSAQTTFSGRKIIAPGRPFFDTWMSAMICERATAQVCVSYASSYRQWQLVAICEDAVVTVEIEQNRIAVCSKTRWGRFYGPIDVAMKLGAQEIKRAVRNVADEVATSLHPDAPTDPYFTSMAGSIMAFHDQPGDAQPRVDAEFAKQVVAMCEACSDRVPTDVPHVLPRRRMRQPEQCDVLVTGGTGFIGKHVIKQLLSTGATVRVMARGVDGLPDLFFDEAIQVVQGDITDAEAVSRAVHGARKVAHLATGDFSDVQRADVSIVQATGRIAEACLREGVERLLFTGTIASLYLGDPHEVITGSTPTDPRVGERGAYESAKARAEQVLRRYFHEYALPTCVVRPGVVLGSGGTPFHSGFGIWRGDIHCVGWNQGKNPLPLVLASDVASAIVLALSSDAAAGNTYNLVGDVRLCARECVNELRLALERPLVFHPMHPAQHQAFQLAKWLAKSAVRRRATPVPSYRLIRSMGCVAQFDCSEVKAQLGWTPVSDRTKFIDRALRVRASLSLAEPAAPAVAAQHA